MKLFYLYSSCCSHFFSNLSSLFTFIFIIDGWKGNGYQSPTTKNKSRGSGLSFLLFDLPLIVFLVGGRLEGKICRFLKSCRTLDSSSLWAQFHLLFELDVEPKGRSRQIGQLFSFIIFSGADLSTDLQEPLLCLFINWRFLVFFYISILYLLDRL